jgi:hypothetical protein
VSERRCARCQVADRLSTQTGCYCHCP